MALVLRSLYNYYNYFFHEFNDFRVEQYPLVSSPIPIVILLALYLNFVLKWGPKMMEHRKPFQLKTIIVIFNVIQILINLYIGVMGFHNSYLRSDYSLACQPIELNDSPSMRKLIFITYLYYITKIADLLDTVFFVLRKKYNQVSFLHIYHHSGMVVALYLFTKFMAGSHGTMLGLINAFVHVIMYSYYLVTSFKPEMKRSIWWKKHITQIQLIQFAILIVHFTLPLFRSNCSFPKSLLLCAAIQNLFMFALFSDFYYKAYHQKKKPTLRAANTAAAAVVAVAADD